MTKEKEKKFERELDIVQFYTLAKKYGFCNPYCECGLCKKPEQINWPIACFTRRSNVSSSLTLGIWKVNKETVNMV